MAVAASVFDETQRATLEALCDTFVPAVETDTGDPVERDFLARSAGDLLVAAQIEGMLAEAMTPEEIAGVAGLLDALAEQGLAPDTPLEARTQIVHGMRAADPEAKLGLTQIKGLTMLLFYGAPDESTGLQRQLGGAGVPGADLARAVAGGGAEDDLASPRSAASRPRCPCDVCVVGSGAGGSVIAAEARGGGQERARAGDGPVPQRVGLQPARGAGLPGALLRRRAGHVRGRVDFDTRRPDAGRRHRRQLHELHPHAGADHARVGVARARGSRGPRGVLPRAHRRGDGAARRQHRGHEAERDAPQADGGRSTRWATSTGRSCETRRSTTRPRTAATARWGASTAASARR